MLTTASLLSILFMTFHLTDEILRQGGMAHAGAASPGETTSSSGRSSRSA